MVGTTQTISVFDKEWVHFGAENKRTVDIPVSLPPASETYSNINGRFRLECPTVTGGCDHWDRYGTFGIVLNAGEEDETLVEIDRFITPYRTGFGWEADLTAYRPLLTGDVTLRVFIDTWVSEGHSDGAGWLFTADLDFEGGAEGAVIGRGRPRPVDQGGWIDGAGQRRKAPRAEPTAPRGFAARTGNGPECLEH